MIKMLTIKFRCLALLLLIFVIPTIAFAYNDNKKYNTDSLNLEKTTCCESKKAGYWYLGGEFFSPFFFGDFYSITPNKTTIGLGGQVRLGYQFSPIFSLEISGGYGRNSAFPLSYQYNYMLGIRDSYTYYPYTMIDGTLYTPVKDMFGEQGNNNLSASIDGIRFDKIKSEISVFQSSVNAVFNLNRLFSLSAAKKEQRFVLLIKPGLYLSRFDSKVVNRENGERVAPKVNRRFTLGAGGDLTIRYNASKKWTFELTNRFIWERDKAIDGILSSKRAYDNYVWQPAFSLVYKFSRKNYKVKSQPSLEVATSGVRELQNDVSMPFFRVSPPESISEVSPKIRTHITTISLVYPLNKTYIDTNLPGNREELARVTDELQVYVNNPDVKINKVSIEGFASPEGPFLNNLRLSEGRALSIIDYIKKRMTLPESILSLGYTEENWIGLKEALENSSIDNKKEILDIISLPDTEQRKKAMSKLSNYDYLLKSIYPSLRKSKCRIEYEVRRFSPLEAKQRIDQSPETLSPEEIYSVVLLQDEMSDKYTEYLHVLYSLYPDSDISLQMKGLECMKRKDYNNAIKYLERVQNKTPKVYNSLAVSYVNISDFDNGLKYLSLSEKEDLDAKYNLRKLKSYLLELKK